MAATTGSLRELLESLRFDQATNTNAENQPPSNDEGRVYGDDDDDDEDQGPDTTEDESTSSSNKSYLDAGYSNEEDYLFDQYGGIGGTAEERASLAEALAHTLDVGPMADDLFYEEVAMCFLRCRERYKMRIWREERKRSRRKKREAGGENRRSSMTSGDEGDEQIKHGMAKMNMRDSGPVDSEYEVHDDEDDDSELEPIVEGMRSVNVESDFEDVRADRRRRGGEAHERDDDDFSVPSDTSPLGDDYDVDADSFMVPNNKGMPSSGTSDEDEGYDMHTNLRAKSYNHEHDARRTDRSSMFTNAHGRDYSFGMGDSDGDDATNLDRERTARSSMFTNANGKGYSFGPGHERNGPASDDDDEFFATDPRGGRSEGEMERDDEDDTQYHRRVSDLTGNSGQDREGPGDGTHIPTFRVDMKSEKNKKGAKNKGQRYPPPPPPPPPPRQHSEHTAHSYEQGSPMDIDPEMEGLTYEEKMAMGARKLAEDSALKNDHESLRKGFTVGSAGEGDKKNHKGKHHRAPFVAAPHKREKSFYGFDDATTAQDDITEVAEDDEQGLAQRQQVSLLRDEGRSYYINGAYKESVLKYTDAIKVHTDNKPNHHNNTANDNTLAALYGNRAAALMMTGAYSGAAADCNRALQCTANDTNTGSLESGPAFRSKILCRMARALLKAGNVWDAEKAFQSAGEAAAQDLNMLGRSGVSPEEARQAEKILGQCQTDATLGLSDVKRYRDSLEGATKISAENSNKGVNLATDRRNSVQLLMFINATLSVSPGSMELHERKVQALATLKRWAELGNHCERLAAEMVKIDGIFQGDLASLNPFPDVRSATSLKPDFFEKNPDDIADPPALRILSPKAVCDAVLRLPNGILPLYLRSLRLEERYTEAAKAGASIETHMSNSKHKSGRGNVSMQWLANERDKLRRTMSWKEKGDTLFRSGDYERAAAKYAQCLGIDGDATEYDSNPLDNEDAGGRLHAVLHCNRAACLMALKKYREAVKECTASLRIHTHYMKAMLRRGRCFARIRQYQEAVSEYERYIQLVDEAKRSPQSALNSNAACTFDRPIDITPTEYSKAKQELADVKKSMKQATANAQAQKDKQTESQQWYNNNFRKAAASNAANRRKQEAPGSQNNNTTQARKQHWEASGSNTRRWDQFGGASPKKQNSQRKSKDAPMGGGGTGPSTGPGANRKNQSQQQSQPAAAAKDAFCHYTVLELTMTASSAEIKKAYHKMALKYHPDKNSEEGAADIFRRIKLAYEVLGNDDTRFAYDAEQRRRGRR